MFFPEQCKIVKLYHGAADSIACDVISAKNAVGPIWFVIFHYSGGGDLDLTLSLVEGVSVSSCATAITETFPIWSDTDAGTSSDTLVRQTDAYNYKIDTGAGTDYMVVFQWDPAKQTEGYDCISIADSGGHGSNTCTILAIYESKYQGASLPSAIID
jgi:hypothetical protein